MLLDLVGVCVSSTELFLVEICTCASFLHLSYTIHREKFWPLADQDTLSLMAQRLAGGCFYLSLRRLDPFTDNMNREKVIISDLGLNLLVCSPLLKFKSM